MLFALTVISAVLGSSYPLFRETAIVIYLTVAFLAWLLARKLRWREATEAELHESRHDLLEAQRVGRLGSWKLDLKSGHIAMSDQARQILELPPDLHFTSPVEAMNLVVHPDDRAEILHAFEQTLGGKPVEVELRVITPSGQIKWVRSLAETSFDRDGRPVGSCGTIQEFTEIKEAQIRLIESERAYRLLSENMSDLVSLHDTDGTLLFASNTYGNIVGYSPVELVGRNMYEWVHPDDVPRLRNELVEQIRIGKVELRTEFRILHRDGHYLWLECLAGSVHGDDGRILHIQASCRDVTRQRVALDALRESEERFRRLIEFTSDWYWETDTDYRFTKLSVGGDAYENVIGGSLGKRRWESPYNRASTAAWEEHKATIAARKPFKDLVFEFVNPATGNVREYSSISGEPYYSDTGEFKGYRGTGRFISQQKRYELALAKRTDELAEVNTRLSQEALKRREIERNVLLAIEMELAQVGLELHDELGQNLTGIALLAKALQNRLAERELNESIEAARILSLVNETIRQTRLVSHGLSPHILGPKGLIEALTQLTHDVNSLGSVICRLVCDENIRVSDDLTARSLYRIAQEAINNSLKHSKAKSIIVELRIVGSQTRLTISDNGIGINRFGSEAQGHAALHSIKYRAGVINATLRITTKDAGGTEISVILPGETAGTSIQSTEVTGD